MTAKDAAVTIGKSTPITIAFAVSLCMGFFWTGGELTKLRLGVQSNSDRNDAQDDLHERSQLLLDELRDLSRDSQRRLEYLEGMRP